MKMMLPALAFLVLFLPAPADAGWELVRGSGPLASFESSARPAVAVKTSCGFSTVAQGKMTVMLHDERSLDGMENGTVWYCLSARDGAAGTPATWVPSSKTLASFIPAAATDRTQGISASSCALSVLTRGWTPSRRTTRAGTPAFW